MIKVGIVGYGTIGMRVADAVEAQPDMKVVGVIKRNPDYKALIAKHKGYRLFTVSTSQIDLFKERGLEVEGEMTSLLNVCDVIVDASPAGAGAKNAALYPGNVRQIYQGGESASVGEVSFVSEVSYEKAFGKNRIRVVSCNTTALCRSLHSLLQVGKIRHVQAFLVRRGADPNEHKKGPIDSIVLDLDNIPSHHAEDVKTVMGNINIFTLAVKAPTTHMHIHFMSIEFQEKIHRMDVVDVFEDAKRIAVIDYQDGFESTGQIFDFSRALRDRGNIYETMVWRDSIVVEDSRLTYVQAVHQEAIVVPDNVDAIRASLGEVTFKESYYTTNNVLGISGRLR